MSKPKTTEARAYIEVADGEFVGFEEALADPKLRKKALEHIARELDDVRLSCTRFEELAGVVKAITAFLDNQMLERSAENLARRTGRK